MQVTIKDIPVFYDVVGAGTPVLMIHGWSPDHRIMKGCMEPVFASQERPWKRIYFDLPGMGRTPGNPWIDGSDAMLDLVLGFVDAVIPGERFLVVGESYGGYLARGLVARRPDATDGMLLICPLGRPHIVTETGVDKGDVPELTVLERDGGLLASLTDKERDQFEGLTVLQNERVWRRYRDEIAPGLDLADYDFLDNCLGRNVPFTIPIDGAIAPYARPALILTGRQDCATGYREVWKFLESYPRATFAVLDKAGHNLQIERDGVFEALVREWLDRVVAAEPATPPRSRR
jgi:pimeloyl-ACP methyl ester carboxylesterase